MGTKSEKNNSQKTVKIRLEVPADLYDRIKHITVFTDLTIGEFLRSAAVNRINLYHFNRQMDREPEKQPIVTIDDPKITA